MEFKTLLLYVVGIYVIYYAANILYDLTLAKLKKNTPANNDREFDISDMAENFQTVEVESPASPSERGGGEKKNRGIIQLTGKMKPADLMKLVEKQLLEPEKNPLGNARLAFASL